MSDRELLREARELLNLAWMRDPYEYDRIKLIERIDAALSAPGVVVPKTLLARILNAYADAHDGDCAIALEQGEIGCECGNDELMAEVAKLLEGEDIDALLLRAAQQNAAAPQPSTATTAITAAPSDKGVGQGDAADAAAPLAPRFPDDFDCGVKHAYDIASLHSELPQALAAIESELQDNSPMPQQQECPFCARIRDRQAPLAPGLLRCADQLLRMVAQWGHPDYSAREFCEGCRQVAAELRRAAGEDK